MNGALRTAQRAKVRVEKKIGAAKGKASLTPREAAALLRSLDVEKREADRALATARTMSDRLEAAVRAAAEVRRPSGGGAA